MLTELSRLKVTFGLFDIKGRLPLTQITLRSMRKVSSISVFTLLLSLLVPQPAYAITHVVSTFSELQTAFSQAADGDVIEFAADIVTANNNSTLTTAKDITIDGKGYKWTVARTGITDGGLVNSNPTDSGLVAFQTGADAVLKNLSMYGGGDGSNEYVVRVYSGVNLQILDSSIERGANGAIGNQGNVYFENVRMVRNSKFSAGAFNNFAGGTMVIVNSTFAENRSTDSNSGGGAGINAGTMWVVNSTFANNFSVGRGSAIFNNAGTLYLSHSTFVGNLGKGTNACGAIANHNGGSAKINSSLFAYNYEVISSAYTLIDVGNLVGTPCAGATVEVSNSMVHSADQTWLDSKGSANSTYSANPNGSDDTLFSGGALVTPTGYNGEQITSPNAKIFRPNLIVQAGLPVAVLKENNTTPNLSSAAPVYFNANGASTILGYWDGTQWLAMSGTIPGGVTSAADANLLTDQVGVTYLPSAAVGATELRSAATYSVMAVKQTGGDVTGASIYGDSYPANTRIEVSAIPSTGYVFDEWQISLASGATLQSQDNPVAFNLTSNSVITPVFAVAPANTYQVTYAGNGATAGSAPSAVTLDNTSGFDHTVQGNTGALERLGFEFDGWNTFANGAGTDYQAGAVISSISANITLYAQWAPVATVTITYDGNFNDTGSSPTAVVVNVNSTVTVAGNSGSLQKTGFQFDGWNSAANGTGTNYAAGDTFTASGATTLYAKWTQLFTITYDGNGSTSGTTPSAQTGAGSITLAGNPGSLERTGHDFLGWSTSNTATSAIVGAYSLVANVTLYAVWELRPATSQSSASRPYEGPLNLSHGESSEFCSEASVIVSGERLATIESVTVGDVEVPHEMLGDGTLRYSLAGIKPGGYQVRFSVPVSSLVLTSQIQVTDCEIPVVDTGLRGKVNVGSFNGKLVVYALNLDGSRITWKVGGIWGQDFADGNVLNRFDRLTPRKGVTVKVDIYVDGVKRLTKSVLTR